MHNNYNYNYNKIYTIIMYKTFIYTQRNMSYYNMLTEL